MRDVTITSHSTFAKVIYDANVQRYQQAANPLRSHGPDHHYRVYENALELAEKLGVSYDDDVLAAACLLHDLAAYYPEKSGDNYHDFDAVFAREVLQEISFPADKTEPALYAITHHGSDSKYKAEDEPIEATLLRDADKMEAFGPIGMARIVMVRTLNGDTMQEIVDDFYTNGHLKRKWDSITYDETRELAGDDYEYSLDFFKQVAKTLKN